MFCGRCNGKIEKKNQVGCNWHSSPHKSASEQVPRSRPDSTLALAVAICLVEYDHEQGDKDALIQSLSFFSSLALELKIFLRRLSASGLSTVPD